MLVPAPSATLLDSLKTSRQSIVQLLLRFGPLKNLVLVGANNNGGSRAPHVMKFNRRVYCIPSLPKIT